MLENLFQYCLAKETRPERSAELDLAPNPNYIYKYTRKMISLCLDTIGTYCRDRLLKNLQHGGGGNYLD